MLALLVLIGMGAGAYYYAPVRLSALVLMGRSPVCSLENAVKAEENVRATTVIKDRILAASRLVEKDSGLHLWETPKGHFWIPEGSDYMLPWNLAEQERKIYGTGPQAVGKGDIVLDCGANVGVYTRVALDAGAKLVVAIEPAPENLECLRRNLGEEVRAGRVIIYEKGVWDKDDFLTLNVDPHNSAADSFVIRREGGHAAAKVPLTAIDKLVAELKLERVDYIKMDIEGAEQRALIGAQQTLGRFHPRLAISTYHAPDDPQKVPELVRKAWPGYRMECGPCAEANGRVRPDVLYFR